MPPRKSKGSTSSASSSSQARVIYEISPEDVVCGRGDQHVSQAGNLRFYQTIDDYLEQYKRANTKFEKSRVVVSIFASIDPGKFLKKQGSSYELMDDKEARQKISHALRYRLRSQKKKRNESNGNNNNNNNNNATTNGNESDDTDQSESQSPSRPSPPAARTAATQQPFALPPSAAHGGFQFLPQHSPQMPFILTNYPLLQQGGHDFSQLLRGSNNNGAGAVAAGSGPFAIPGQHSHNHHNHIQNLLEYLGPAGAPGSSYSQPPPMDEAAMIGAAVAASIRNNGGGNNINNSNGNSPSSSMLLQQILNSATAAGSQHMQFPQLQNSLYLQPQQQQLSAYYQMTNPQVPPAPPSSDLHSQIMAALRLMANPNTTTTTSTTSNSNSGGSSSGNDHHARMADTFLRAPQTFTPPQMNENSSQDVD